MSVIARFLAVSALLFSLSPGQAHSNEVSVGNLIFIHPFARATAGPARTGAIFTGIKNDGDQADRLLAVSVSTDIAGKAEIHTHIMENHVAKMRKVEGGIHIPVGGMVMLQPGGPHIMLMKLAAPLKEGEDFRLTLKFERAGDVALRIPVLGVGAGASPQTSHGAMDHGAMEHEGLNQGDGPTQ